MATSFSVFSKNAVEAELMQNIQRQYLESMSINFSYPKNAKN